MRPPTIHVYGMAGWNLGDDAIAVVLNRGLASRLEGANIRTACIAPGTFHARYGLGEIPVDRRSVRGLLAWADSVRRADVAVIGGGTLVQDALGIGPLRGNLAYTAQIAGIASLAGTPLVAAGLGVDRLGTRLGRRYAGFALRRTRHTWVRDARSAELAREYACRPIHGLVVGGDPAVLLETMMPTSLPASRTRPPYLVVSLVREGDVIEPWLPIVRDALRTFLTAHPGARVALLAMDVRPDQERSVFARIARGFEGLGSAIEVVVPADAFEALAWVSRARAMIAMRLHAMILGLGRTPMIAISRTTKTDTFVRETGLESFDVGAPPTADALARAIADAWAGRVDTAAQRSVRARMEATASTALDALAAACASALQLKHGSAIS